MIKISAFLLLIGLAPLALGVLVLTVANVIPSEIPLAWAGIIVGGIYAVAGMIHMTTRKLEKALHISRIPFWIYIVVLPPILILCYMQISPLYR